MGFIDRTGKRTGSEEIGSDTKQKENRSLGHHTAYSLHGQRPGAFGLPDSHLFDGALRADMEGVGGSLREVEGLLSGLGPRAPPHRDRPLQLQLHLDEARVLTVGDLGGGGGEGRVS